MFLYGKFLEKIDDMIWNYIINVADNKEFLLVIDAINEIDKTTREDFYSKVLEFSKSKFGRVVLSYRQCDPAPEICTRKNVSNVI